MIGPAGRIVGREHELGVLLAAIDAVESAGSAIAVRGEPGIGKSVLLEAAARHGQERGRLQLAFGRWLRRRHQVTEARESLRAAHATLSGIGATIWADQAEP